MEKEEKNVVKKVFTDMTDLEISRAIREMKEDEPQGIIREDGVVREKCKRVHALIGGNVYAQLTMVQYLILQESAYRFTPEEKDL
jgi:hypothetical protein